MEEVREVLDLGVPKGLHTQAQEPVPRVQSTGRLREAETDG